MIWLEYQISQIELEEASELCSSNWEEIQYLYDRINYLEDIIRRASVINLQIENEFSIK